MGRVDLLHALYIHFPHYHCFVPQNDRVVHTNAIMLLYVMMMMIIELCDTLEGKQPFTIHQSITISPGNTQPLSQLNF